MVIISKDQVREPLYAVVPLFNPWRWKSRWKHTMRAIKHFADSGATVILVEAGFNRRELVFADSGLDGTANSCALLASDPKFNHRYIGLHTQSELWLKEQLIRIGVQALPYDWEQVCWMDSDVVLIRPNWVGEAIHKLQHYSFLQMFSHARDVGPDYEMLPEQFPHANGVGFIQAWKDGRIISTPKLDPVIKADLQRLEQDVARVVADESSASRQRDMAKVLSDERNLNRDLYPYGLPHVFPGLAWACTRKAWDDVGGLIDFAVWGGADHHTSCALVGKTDGMMRGDLHPNYKNLVSQKPRGSKLRTPRRPRLGSPFSQKVGGLKSRLLLVGARSPLNERQESERRRAAIEHYRTLSNVFRVPGNLLP